MKYTSEQIIPQDYIGTYGKSVIEHIHNVLNKNLADAIIENSEQDVVIHFSDFYEQPTEIISHSVCMRRDVTIKPLVRCKDCKWYVIDELRKDGEVDRRYKPSVCYLYLQYQEETYFCADGERRENAN